MSRPQRCRRICNEPQTTEFSPVGAVNVEAITLTLDEFEVIRLVDLERQTHEQCAKQMDISRSTVTEIYENARYKIADSIVNGYRLNIAGGNYRICDGSAVRCHKKHCHKQQSVNAFKSILKGEHTMKIAVTYENGEIFQHFGHSEQFKMYDIQERSIVSSQVVDTNGSGHGALVEFLSANEVDILICGGIGGGAQTALANAGIRLYGGVSGNADEAVNALLDDSLAFNPDVHCDHHDHQHENEEHTCGSHGCGNHGCH